GFFERLMAPNSGDNSALSAIKRIWSWGTSSSAKMALAGHSGTQTAQSMHSSGSITKKLGPSRKQSTGQTSTQSVNLHLIQFSVTTCVIGKLQRLNTGILPSNPWPSSAPLPQTRPLPLNIYGACRLSGPDLVLWLAKFFHCGFPMIITSLQDTDLYKFSMMQVVQHHYPAAQVEYRYKCRTPNVSLVPYLDEIRQEIHHVCQLRFTEDELEYLRG